MKQTEAGDRLSQPVVQPHSPVWTQRVKRLGIRLMQYVLTTLRNTDRSVPAYVWRAWLIVAIPSFLISNALIELFGPRHSVSFDTFPSWIISWWFGTLLIGGSWIETLMMWPILSILKRVLGTTIWVSLVSGLVWGSIHAFGGGQWGVSQVWSFFVLSVCFLAWEKRSKGKAILVTGLVHACHNMIHFLGLILLACIFC